MPENYSSLNITTSTESSKSTISTESTKYSISTESTKSSKSTESSESPTESTESSSSTEPSDSTGSAMLRGRKETPQPNSVFEYENPTALPCESVEHEKYLGKHTVFTATCEQSRAESVKELLRLDHLNDEEHSVVEALVEANSDLFYLPGDRLGKTTAIQHKIPTINDQPIHVKQYRFPPIHREEITRQVSELLENDIIRPSTSPYSSPIWVVPKKPDSHGNKRWRMVIDYRALNENSIADAYPLPNITEILDQLGSAKYFSTFDLASGFHQIPLAEQDAEKTAFSTPYGHYQFNRMPFGLRNAPSTFQRLMDSVLSGLQGNEMFVYLDDIVIYASSLTEHNIKFKNLAARLREANLFLQPDKCEFLRREVAYLGHVIGRDGVKPDPRNVSAVKNFPVPKDAKGVRQFLGLAGYYRRFIPKFADIAKSLTLLLKKDIKFEWKQEQERAFMTLRDMLCTEPILQYPDFSKPFIVTTDASGHAIGAVLSQGIIGRDMLCTEPILQYPDFSKPFIVSTDASGHAIGAVLSQGIIGKDLPIAYTSRVLNAAELNYPTIEKECLAIMYAVQHFRPYIYGREFQLVTDHRPLVWLHSVKDPQSRLVRWRLKLAEFEYRVVYKQGKENMNADALSRNPVQIFPLTTGSESSSDDALFSPPSSLQSRPPPTERPASPTITLPPYRLDASPPHTTPTHTDSLHLPQHTPDPCPSDTADWSPIDNDSPTNLADIPQYDSDDSTDDELFVSDDQPFIQHHRLITETRDKLSMRRDNTVYFMTMKGEPLDRSAEEFLTAYHIQSPPGIFLNRARVIPYNNSKHAIGLPIKSSLREPAKKDNIAEALTSLLEVVRELELKTFSIARVAIDDVSWPVVQSLIIQIFHLNPVKIIVCQGLTRTPPQEERENIITECHTSAFGGHKGVSKTYSRIREKYYWGTMKAEVQKFIQNCQSCQIQKLTRQKTRQPMTLTDTPGAAFDKISMDIVGPLPTTSNNSSYILTMQDLLTKYSVAAPLQKASAVDAAEAFVNVFICKHGAPKALITDQGSHFLNSLFKVIAKRFKISHYRTTAFHPQSNGSIERSHHVLAEYLKHFISKNQEWDTWLPMAMFSYNTSVHESTRFTPHELVYGKLARVPSSDASPLDLADEGYTTYLRDLNLKIYDTQTQAKQNLNTAKLKYKHYYDRKLKPVEFHVGDKVFLLKEPRKGKFDAQYTGPYVVTQLFANNNVEITIRNKSRVVHSNKLKMCKYAK
ncbi:PREDICTED: uncharacterized protein LOC108578250 [Habropoda laboriosa]|uniref:uncharacterized protein LOC108578250 n=1 Tax=Habropoda laboriosa TaxID=597456 RepID=UPI00083DC512|nr:PREDICTED: uncharacterized protein LOC108578250 [Habropoda laboriosa]